MDIDPFLDFSQRKQLRSWLEEHYSSVRYCWVPCNRTCKKMPDGRLAQRISPRRKGSQWTELNMQRCADLERRGLMTDAGRKALACALPHPTA